MSRYGKRILAAGVCATMTMGLLTGCSSSTGKTVAKMGDAEITLGEAEFMLRYNQAKTQGYLGALFGEGSNVFQQDLTGSGQAYGVTMKESVMNDLKDMILMEQHMSDYNVELTDEEKAAIEETAKEFLAENSKDVLKALAATEETVTRVLTLYTIQSKMQTAIEADVDTEVSDDEAAQKSIQYVYFTIPETESEAEDTTEAESGSEEDTTEAVTDAAEESGEIVAETESETVSETETAAEETSEAVSENGTEDASEAVSENDTEEATEAETEESAEKKETRETAQSVIDAVLGGETLEDAVKAVDENKSVTDYSYGADEETLNENLKNVADTLSDGEIAAEPVEGENGFYVVQMVSTFDREATDQKKEEIINDRKQELLNSVLEGWATDSFDIDEKVWDTVTFDDIITLKSTEAETEEGTDDAADTDIESETDSEAASETESAAEETESETQSETE
ncbi:peptidylprolyl isomerase [Jingyaoa shaoxingensis]|uniref:Peptidylprolyl isomerase n=1 Tax=Jingyaoa shaoxingensis TaxID=2763671 RepID=A0ABR7N8F1_9FIRM|nr:hypothetical protein [Jingyaoa shaoxingensis]MBC8572127.1 hypothetical protein [Jingyaoa shaoxingensis]